MPELVPVYTAAQVREAERPLIEAGVPLMSRAAAALARVTGALVAASSGRRVLVLVGGGDNGGDALFAAALLLADGAARARAVDVLPTSPAHHAKGLAAALAAGARIVDAAEAAASRPDVVIDGILGTGTHGAPVLRGTARDVVSTLIPDAASRTIAVVAVDLPSGLHPDDGTTADGLVLPASVTVTFGAVKAGLVRGRGPELAGRVVLADIGLGPALAASEPVGEAEVESVIDVARDASPG
ncbi:NAD(P)H-hydrate epimerase [Microbacterium ulmi]|uniref:NAD(P)H-hydrate epimerase n=1 Tax=Microbacterium ulmi TaxID=179095 RepID=UPI003132B616|nr:hydroxyethylthiazole kinase-like uncharacterized protein yjeF [Microbacterium ulmi]